VLSGSPVYFTATVTAGPATTIEKFSGDNLLGPVGTALQTPHVVLIADAHGNPAPGVSVTWAAAQGGGHGARVTMTGANGLASTGADPGIMRDADHQATATVPVGRAR
jgi:hypothetical protein